MADFVAENRSWASSVGILKRGLREGAKTLLQARYELGDPLSLDVVSAFRHRREFGRVPIDARWTTAAAILQAADTSCYAAKENGRNRVQTWNDSDLAMRERHGEMQWSARIENALDNDGFVLYAQRIEALRRPPGGMRVEVLLRMVDGDGALVPPGVFFSAAERLGLASRIVVHDPGPSTRCCAWSRSPRRTKAARGLMIDAAVVSRLRARVVHPGVGPSSREASYGNCNDLYGTALAESARGLGVAADLQRRQHPTPRGMRCRRRRAAVDLSGADRSRAGRVGTRHDGRQRQFPGGAQLFPRSQPV